jgi:hypothetical protein
MFIGNFIVQYFLMSFITTNRLSNFTNSLGKAYLSIIMAIFMVIIEIMMHDHQYNVFSVKSYSIAAFILGIFIYLYKKQVFINDNQYLQEMIEHHSMALLTSEQILEKTDNYNVAKVAKNIIQQQEEQIAFMRDISNP